MEELIKEAYEWGMIQNMYEIFHGANFIKEKNLNNFMEIGTDRGGTFLIWSKITNPNGLKISVDLPLFDISLRNERMKKLGDKVIIIEEDSHEERCRNLISDSLNGELLDFLFIDGDHSYLGVKLDFYMYKDFVKPGGWIGFHDIKSTKHHHDTGIFVDKFWEELNYKKYWFLSGTNWGGIGFIQI